MNLNTISRRAVLTASTIAIAAVGVLPATAAFADAPATATVSAGQKAVAQTPSDVLASTPWKTTSALDANGNKVALDNPAVSNFVGWAYFKADGTFTMYNLDNSPKMHGDWTVPADGSSRWIAAKDANGNVLFQRVVPIVELDKHAFTYRVFPNAADTSVYYDIVHTPTNHVEPGTDAKGPGTNGTQGNQGNGGYHFNNGNQH
ncbi:DUF4822 domain-containing protein [Microbacterium sp. ASV49]|uniref:DUF4822 domain-containing protein n=1 Tax=Microbacterium candidum TaxID=3041922 RepID=A0ABT7MU12_9MICO|nr:DUF4822 domain-containing protein [Microbacterium sp. ASV49]MDL9977923.1 DUF4822 domain-containing protein [Microbacterium sp. ASV49]